MAGNVAEQKKLILPFLQACPCLLLFDAAVDARTQSLKHILHNLICELRVTQRADEVAPVEPKIAYYCRLYAVEQVPVPIRQPSLCSECQQTHLSVHWDKCSKQACCDA